MTDDWLDAFDDADFDDPKLTAIDDAVARLMDAPEVPSRSARAWLGWGVAAAAVALLAAGLGWVWLPEDIAEPMDVATSPVAAPQAVHDVVRPSAPDDRAKPMVVEHTAPPPPVSPIADAAAIADPPAPHNVQPGLRPFPGAALRVADDVAILETGVVAYRRDVDHDPGVHAVHLTSLPVRLRPLGTAFTVGAAQGVGAIVVTEHRVQLEHSSGHGLATAAAGEEWLLLDAPHATHGLRVVNTTGLPLDQLTAQIPEDCLCRARDVVRTVARLRVGLR